LLESDQVIAEEITLDLGNFGYSVSHHRGKITDLVSLVLKEKPDLILMEVKAGEELKSAEAAQRVYDNCRVPVIFLTTVAGRTIIEKSKRAYLLGFVFKPLKEKELISTIELTLFRYSMESKLMESEKKYGELSNSIFQVIIECDLGGKILSLNRYGLEKFGLTAEDIQRGVQLSDYILENECGSILEVSAQNSYTDVADLNREFTLVNKLGRKYVIEELLSPVYSNCRLSGYRGILIDITNKKLKQRLDETFSNICLLYDRPEADVEEISDYVVRELKELLPGLENIYFEGYAKEKEVVSENEALSFFKGYPEFVMRSNKPLFLRGREFELFNQKEKLINADIYDACWMAFPIFSTVKPYGVFVLYSRSNRNALSVKDFEKLNDFFNNMVLFLEKINYLKELKRSENLFKSVVNTINEGLIKIDLDSNVTYVNNRISEMSGYSIEEVIGKKSAEFLEAKDIKLLSKVIENRKKGISSQYEMNIKVKTGEYRDFYVNGAPYRDENGVVIGALGTLTDITDKKRQLALYAATETLLHEITSAIDVAFWIYSFETKSIQYLSPAFETIFEVELKDIYKIKSLRRFVDQDDIRAVLQRSVADIDKGEDELKYRIITPKGDLKWIQDKSVLVKDHNGNITKIIGYSQEITNLKLAEERLLKSETEKDNIIRSIPDSFMILDYKNEIVDSYFKSSEAEFLLKKVKHIQGKNVSKVFDEKIARLMIENAQLSYTAREIVMFELDTTQNDVTYWFEVRMTAMNSEKVLMIIRNITAIKNNINKIQKLFNITEQTKELIMITDATGKIEYVNPMFTVVTGYEPAEVLGNNPSILKSKKHSKSFYAGVWNTLKTGEVFKADFYNTKKSGELFIEEKIITPYIDINGEITNFISTGRDVTLERKSAIKTKKHKHLERTLAIKQQKNRTLSLIQGHENERRKFAKEIHEGLNQMLAVAMMNLENISTNELIDVEQKAKIEFVNKMVAEITQELRGISTNLSPVSLFEFGLHAVVQQMINRLNAKLKNANISFKSNIAGLRFTEEVEINFYRIIQEALQNALKHSRARKIYLALNFSENKLVFLIRDNGIGINKREFEMKKKKFFGISALEQRAAAMGAQLELTTNKNKGFEINMAVQTKTINYD